ncbi:MAG TPA: DUF4255 domain-containing protein [Longimicrobium sp.]|jgi:hypothetical protein
MLDVAMEFLKDELNAYLAARNGTDQVKAQLTRVMNDQNQVAIEPNSLAMTVINIEEERTFKAQVPTHAYTQGRHVVHEPELKVNLLVMVSAFFSNYAEALKHLSCALTWSQAHPAFNPTRSPALDPRIEKLTLELQTLAFEQLNQVWAFVGSKQLPSIFLRVRMVVLQDAEPAAVQPPITAVSAALSGR